MKPSIIFTLVAVLLLFTACEKQLIGPSGANSDPEVNFNELWQGYRDYYGLFEAKGIDWEAAYQENKDKVNKATTEQELAEIFKSLICPLNDIHSFIIPVNNPGLPARIESCSVFDTLLVQTDYRKEVVDQYYLNSVKTQGEFIEYGWLENSIGYIHMTAMEGSLKFIEESMDVILEELKSAQGIVVDIRNNSGGDDRVSKYVAGCFAPQSKLFMKIRKKSGPGHQDFTPWQDWFVEPEGSHTYTKPVVLLTSRWSQSAAETFALAMRENENVTIVGDYTAGGFSDVVAKELPNGWLYFVSIGDYRAADGISYEGVGVPPDVLKVSSRKQLQAGKDEALEHAVQILMN